MIVKFYGTRGSTPVCESGFREFGGNTSCVLIDGPDRVCILDAGTGIRQLGKEMLASDEPRFRRPVLMLFSHFHWDHIQGFPFFAPAYDPARHFVIMAMGVDRFQHNLRSVFSRQMEDTFFPVSMDQMGATFTFKQPSGDYVTEEDVPEMNTPVPPPHGQEARVTGILHNHPGGAYSYRIDGQNGKIITYCTDIEYVDGVIDERIVDLARGADLLIHDAQYTPEELRTHRRWGHSSWDQACEVAERAGVKLLALTHHDPNHDDEMLRTMEKACQQRFQNSVFARDQMEVDV
jgi:phosphoribosyl 1,2-cyclic phosphodiesterase